MRRALLLVLAVVVGLGVVVFAMLKVDTHALLKNADDNPVTTTTAPLATTSTAPPVQAALTFVPNVLGLSPRQATLALGSVGLQVTLSPASAATCEIEPPPCALVATGAGSCIGPTRRVTVVVAQTPQPSAEVRAGSWVIVDTC